MDQGEGVRVMQRDVITDLVTEADELDEMLAGLDENQWTTATPAPGWTVAHQVAHLASTYRLATLSAADPEGFKALTAQLSDDFDANVAGALANYLGDPPQVLFSRWKDERATAVKALAALPLDQVVPWLVRPLTAGILAGAGMMELFAHGQDIADAVGVTPVRTDRVRHLVEFAVRTWDFGYLARDLTPPDTQFWFELTAPSGAVWTFGPENAMQTITGPAVDLCLLATRRRHHADLDIVAQGPDAEAWLDIAQCYRGTPGAGRRPGQFAATG
jgi:enediyne biosynthesis protein E11